MQITFSIPWNKALLKNNTFGINRRGMGWGAIYRKRDTVLAQEDIILRCKSLITRGGFFKNKISVKIVAYKANHKAGDAVNLVDRFCDAIKYGIGVDDRFFELQVLWEIDKEHPRIYCEITQNPKDCFDLIKRK